MISRGRCRPTWRPDGWPPLMRRPRRCATSSRRWSCGRACRTPPSVAASTSSSCCAWPACSAYAAGEPERALALFDEALAELGTAGDPERVALVLEARSQPLVLLGRGDEARAVLERAASLLPAEPPTMARAVVLASLARMRAVFSGDYETCKEVSEQALSAARAVGAREQEANAQIMLGRGTLLSGGTRGRHREPASRARAG